jgi:exosortase/archaeosortase family protein
MAGVQVAIAPIFPALSTATANVVVWISRLSGLDAAAGPHAQVVFGGSGPSIFRYTITGACTGVELILVYSAVVFAYPATGRRRIVGLALGVPLILIANWLRLVALGWVGLSLPDNFATAHRYWGPVLLIALIGSLWFAWAWFIAGANVRRTEDKRKPPRAELAETSQAQRVRRAAARAGAFLAALGLLGALGLAGGGIAAWGRVTFAPQERIGPLLGVRLPRPLPGVETLETYGPRYAAAVAIVSLFLVAPAVPWRRRIRGALLQGIPAVYVVQVGLGLTLIAAATTFRTSTNTVIGPFLQALTLPLEIGVPAVIWNRWRRATRAVERAPRPRSSQREDRRRANKRHRTARRQARTASRRK